MKDKIQLFASDVIFEEEVVLLPQAVIGDCQLLLLPLSLKGSWLFYYLIKLSIKSKNHILTADHSITHVLSISNHIFV